MSAIDDVIAFWFADPEKQFARDDAFDREIRDRFGALHADVIAGKHDDWRETPHGALAYVIVLDQFSRNLFRDDARAFANDAHSREVAGAAITAGHDRALIDEQRAFLYMPFMHGESLADQDRSIALFADLPKNRAFAEQHRNEIVRFGRFPRRNEALGRESTPDEIAFLDGD